LRIRQVSRRRTGSTSTRHPNRTSPSVGCAFLSRVPARRAEPRSPLSASCASRYAPSDQTDPIAWHKRSRHPALSRLPVRCWRVVRRRRQELIGTHRMWRAADTARAGSMR
jgi:hypothetical protein